MRAGMRYGVVLVATLLTVAATAMASGGTKAEVCVPKKEGSAVVTPKHGKCTKYSSIFGGKGLTASLEYEAIP
jgi:hypothetical protein